MNGSKRPAGAAKLTMDEIQSEVMSFSDTYATRMNDVIDRAMNDADTPELRAKLHHIKISSVTGAYSIASSPNPAVALLDMAAFIKLKREILQEYGAHWLAADSDPQQLVDALLESYRRSEREIWSVIERAFTPEQIAELNELIVKWHEENPDQRQVTQVRLSEFSGIRRLAPSATEHGPTSIFSLFYLDPLSSMNPTAREIEQTRRIAERAFFVAERMPTLMAWQAEQVVYDLAATPEGELLLSDVNTFATAVDRIGTVAEKWPSDMATARETAISQLSEAVAKERRELISELQQTLESQRVGLLNDLEANETMLRSLLESGTQTAESINAMAKSLDALLNPPPTDSPSDARPFDIREYQAAVAEVSRAAHSLQELLQTVERMASEAPESGKGLTFTFDAAEAGGQRLINRVFWLGLILLLVLLIGAPISAMVFRKVARRSES